MVILYDFLVILIGIPNLFSTTRVQNGCAVAPLRRKRGLMAWADVQSDFPTPVVWQAQNPAMNWVFLTSKSFNSRLWFGIIWTMPVQTVSKPGDNSFYKLIPVKIGVVPFAFSVFLFGTHAQWPSFTKWPWARRTNSRQMRISGISRPSSGSRRCEMGPEIFQQPWNTVDSISFYISRDFYGFLPSSNWCRFSLCGIWKVRFDHKTFGISWNITVVETHIGESSTTMHLVCQ